MWALILIAAYFGTAWKWAPPALRWLEEHGYLKDGTVYWPNPRRTDNDRRAGNPGAQPRTGSDEEGRELRRIRTEEDGR